MFERYFREGLIDKKYRPYKAHLYLAFRYSLAEAPPKLIKSRALDAYCEKLLTILKEPQFAQQIKVVLALFDKTHKTWTQQGGSPFGIKDNREFTDLLITQVRTSFAQGQRAKSDDQAGEVSEGRILRVVWRNGVWFGFIKRGPLQENVYFDSRAYKGEPRRLAPDEKVTFEIGRNDRGLFARNVSIASPKAE